MFEVRHIKGNTDYFEAYSNVGIYRLSENKVILIDSCDHKRIVKALNNSLNAENLSVESIICTHCHVDHICGNKTFSDKFGCKIYSTEKEKQFIVEPDLEATFYFAGIDTDKTRNPFFMVEPSYPETISADKLPEGFEIIPLPGHSFDMIGIRTPDDVVFLADSILSEKTWTEFKVPFFHDVNKSIETLKMIKELKAVLFVPSHNEPLENITALADYNIEKLTQLKETVYSLCDGLGFDDLFCEFLKALSLTIRTEKYPNYAVMLRNILQSLVEEEKIRGILSDGKFIYTVG